MSKQHTRALIGTVLGLENEEGEAVLDGSAVTITTGETVIEVEPLSTEGTEGEATVELVEAEGEVEEISTEVETMQENVEALEALAADLETAIADGGLTPQAAVMFQHAHAAIAGRHLDMSRRVLAAESFGSAASRLQMTKDAHEGVIESIKSFIKGIIAFVKKMVTKVVDWFKNLFSSKARLKKRVDALEKAVAAQGTELKDKNAKLTFPAGLTLDGKVPAPAALVNGFSEVADMSKNLSGAQEQVMKFVIEVLGVVKGKQILKGKQVVGDAIASLCVDKSEGTFDESALGSNQIGIAMSKELPGSKVVVNVGPTKSALTSLSPSTALSLEGIKIFDIKKNLKIAEKLEIKPLASGDSLGILKHITSALNAKEMGGEEYKKLADKADDALKALEGIADDAKDDQKEAATTVRSTASGLQGLISNVGAGLLKAEGYAFRTCQLGANLVAASVAAYK